MSPDPNSKVFLSHSGFAGEGEDGYEDEEEGGMAGGAAAAGGRIRVVGGHARTEEDVYSPVSHSKAMRGTDHWYYDSQNPAEDRDKGMTAGRDAAGAGGAAAGDAGGALNRSKGSDISRISEGSGSTEGATTATLLGGKSSSSSSSSAGAAESAVAGEEEEGLTMSQKTGPRANTSSSSGGAGARNLLASGSAGFSSSQASQGTAARYRLAPTAPFMAVHGHSTLPAGSPAKRSAALRAAGVAGGLSFSQNAALPSRTQSLYAGIGAGSSRAGMEDDAMEDEGVHTFTSSQPVGGAAGPRKTVSFNIRSAVSSTSSHSASGAASSITSVSVSLTGSIREGGAAAGAGMEEEDMAAGQPVLKLLPGGGDVSGAEEEDGEAGQPLSQPLSLPTEENTQVVESEDEDDGVQKDKGSSGKLSSSSSASTKAASKGTAGKLSGSKRAAGASTVSGKDAGAGSAGAAGGGLTTWLMGGDAAQKKARK